MPYLSPYHQRVPNSAKFRKNVEILRKWANTACRLKILHSVGNYKLLAGRLKTRSVPGPKIIVDAWSALMG